MKYLILIRFMIMLVIKNMLVNIELNLVKEQMDQFNKFQIQINFFNFIKVYKVWINNTFPIAVKEISLDEEKKIYS